MQTFLLKASPNPALAQADGLGFAYVMVVDEQANGGGIMPGDKVDLTAVGSPAVAAPLIGVMFPWDDHSGGFWGPFRLMNGMFSMSVTVPTSAGQGPFSPEGLLICSSITAGGYRSPFGGEVCDYRNPSAPPTPTVTKGSATLAQALIDAAAGKRPAIAFWAKDVSVPQYAIDFYGNPETIALSFEVCLDDSHSATIADLLGGSVVKLAPPDGYARYTQTPPLVNWIKFTHNGQSLIANAGQLAESFPQIYANTSVADAEAIVLACFKPA